MEALARLHSTVVAAYRVNPNITFEVFIHKVDGLSEDYKIGMTSDLTHRMQLKPTMTDLFFIWLVCHTDTQRDIQQTTTDELADAGLENVQLAFYLTSIYDHSIFEAFSKVIQKLIPQLPTLENLLNILCAVSLWISQNLAFFFFEAHTKTKLFLFLGVLMCLELWHRKGIFVRRNLQDLHRHRFFSCGFSII